MTFHVNVPVNVARMPGSFTAWDYDNSPAFLQPVYKAVTVISLVRDNILTPQIKRFQQLLRIANVITVPWRQQKPQWISQSIHYRMDFRAQSSPAASQCFAAPFFAPLPCWWTLIVVLSSIRVLPSTMSWAISSSKICSQTPCRLHRRNRVYTLFQGPYRSGRSRQGIPVFSQYRIPLSITRLSFPGLPPCAGFSGGSSSFTLFHCSSVNSCRFILLFYCCFLNLSCVCLKTPSSVSPSPEIEDNRVNLSEFASGIIQGMYLWFILHHPRIFCHFTRWGISLFFDIVRCRGPPPSTKPYFSERPLIPTTSTMALIKPSISRRVLRLTRK